MIRVYKQFYQPISSTSPNDLLLLLKKNSREKNSNHTKHSTKIFRLWVLIGYNSIDLQINPVTRAFIPRSCGFIDTLFFALLGIGNMIGTEGENKVALVSIGRDIWLSIKRYRRFFAIGGIGFKGGVLFTSRKATSDRQLKLSATFQNYDRRDNKSQNKHKTQMLWIIQRYFSMYLVMGTPWQILQNYCSSFSCNQGYFLEVAQSLGKRVNSLGKKDDVVQVSNEVLLLCTCGFCDQRTVRFWLVRTPSDWQPFYFR